MDQDTESRNCNSSDLKFLDELLNADKNLTKEEWDKVYKIFVEKKDNVDIANMVAILLKRRIAIPITMKFLGTHREEGTLFMYQTGKEELFDEAWKTAFVSFLAYDPENETKASFSTYAFRQVYGAVEKLFYATISPGGIHYVKNKDEKYVVFRQEEAFLSNPLTIKNEESDKNLEDVVFNLQEEAEELSKKGSKYVLKYLEFFQKKLPPPIFTQFSVIITSKHNTVDTEGHGSVTRQRYSVIFRKVLNEWRKETGEDFYVEIKENYKSASESGDGVNYLEFFEKRLPDVLYGKFLTMVKSNVDIEDLISINKQYGYVFRKILNEWSKKNDRREKTKRASKD